MNDCTKEFTNNPENQGKSSNWSILEEVLREGARKMLQTAIENEVADFIDQYKHRTDENGHRLAVRNGYMPEREITTGIGAIPVKQPRLDDRKLRKDKDTPVFTSQILPRFMRRIPSIDNLIPALYLKGISTGDFSTALTAILGEGVKNLSANTIVRLKEGWETEYNDWTKRDLSNKKYVYFWVDGIYFNVRLEKDRPCVLVVIAADETGKKELLAITDGERESKISWKELLLGLKDRGLKQEPKLVIGDGALGFWSAVQEVYSGSKEQRCWVHKTRNILDKLPKNLHSAAKELIHDMYMADTKELALLAYKRFINIYEDKYPKAVKCLIKDKDRLFTFYDFPAANWIHIRTTNPIESTFATVRLRTYKTKGCGNRTTTLSMVYKLGIEAEKNWKRLKGAKNIPLVPSLLYFDLNSIYYI
jgi:putative transposase